MPAPILDRPPPTSQSAARRDRPFVLAVAALLVAATAVGIGVAVADRQPARPAMAATGTKAPATESAPADDPRPAGVDTAGNAAVLPDGVHHALIRRVDVAGDRVTVDVVQVFHDDAAVKAAIADGKSPADAKYLTTWVHNQNRRLRTLPLAADLRVDFVEPCDEEPDRRAVLRRLAANARLGLYFYSLTVRDGSVHTLLEHQITPAC